MTHSDERDHDSYHEDRMLDSSVHPAGPVVLVGIDGSCTSWDAFHWACGESRRLAGHTVAVFVGPASGGAASAAAAASLAGVAGVYGAIQQTVTDRAGELGDLVRTYAQDQRVNLTFIHTCGDTATELLRIAGSFQADLVVVGRSTKARHHLAGSLGRRLVGRRNAPVIVVVP
jgi:nucleotide-binding universal stress UspA family protein